MRSLLSVAVVLGLAVAPHSARATVHSCGRALLQSPDEALYAGLQVTPGQAIELGWIRDTMNRRRAVLQSNLRQVRLELDPSHDGWLAPALVQRLRRQEATLAEQLHRELSLAASRAAALLSPWQRQRCEQDEPESIILMPPPVVAPRAPVVRPHVPVAEPRCARHHVAAQGAMVCRKSMVSPAP
jgi:hypothetical protein